MKPRQIMGPGNRPPNVQNVTALASEIDPDLSELPDFARLRDYWETKRGDGLPRYAHMDPVDLKEHLGALFVARMIDGGADFRYRLIGTDLTLVHGADYTGRTVTETFSGRYPEFGASVILAYRKCLRKKRPLLANGRVVWVNKDYLEFVALHLPCSSDGTQADIIFGKLVFLRGAGRAGR